MAPEKWEKDAGFYIKRIHDAVTAKINEQLRPYDITASQADLLGYLKHEAPQPATLSDIEQHFHLTHPTVVGLIKRLESKGMITTEIDNTDHRRRLVLLTKQALTVEKTLSQTVTCVKEHFMRGINNEEQQQLNQWLQQIYKNLTEL